MKIHYVLSLALGEEVYGICGRLARRYTTDPEQVTCNSCRWSPYLDDYFGNMTEGGHA